MYDDSNYELIVINVDMSHVEYKQIFLKFYFSES